MAQMETASKEKVIRVYIRHPYNSPRTMYGLVEFDPPIDEYVLRNEVLKWILDDPTQAHFVSFEPDAQGTVSTVEHKMQEGRDSMGRRSNLRSRGDLIDYYFENGGSYHLPE